MCTPSAPKPKPQTKEKPKPRILLSRRQLDDITGLGIKGPAMAFRTNTIGGGGSGATSGAANGLNIPGSTNSGLNISG